MEIRFKVLILVGVLLAATAAMAGVWQLISIQAATALISVLLGVVAVIVGWAWRQSPRNSQSSSVQPGFLIRLVWPLLLGAGLAGFHAWQHGWQKGDTIGSIVFVILFSAYISIYLKRRKRQS
jgi:hypothetical protein